MSVSGRHRSSALRDERTDSAALLALAVQAVGEDLDAGGILRRTVELGCAVTGAEHAVLMPAGDAGGLDEPVTHGDPAALGSGEVLAQPLLVDGRPFATLRLGGRDRPFAGRDTHSVTLLLRAAGAALTQSRERRTYAAERVAEDRDRIAADLRELVGRRLDAAAAQLRQALAEEARGRVEAALQAVEAAAEDVRVAVHELRQGADTPVDALRALAAELADVLGFVPTVRVSGSADRLDDELGEHVLAVVRAVLVEVARRARATRATVELDVSPAWLMLTVTDDGVGPEAEGPEAKGPEAPGLREPAERARRLGGVLRVAQVAPRGTRLDWLVPVRSAGDGG